MQFKIIAEFILQYFRPSLTFNTTSRYLGEILTINNVYFDNMVSQIYPSELQLNKANTSDTEAALLDLHLSISNDIVSTKIYDKRDDFDFEIVNFPFLDGDVPRSTSYGVYISQLIRFARASSYITDFNARNKLLTQKLLKQGYRYHNLRKISKGAKIRNGYNQVPHPTQDTNGKVTHSQLDTTNESQAVSPFPAGDHKAHINRRAQRHSKHKTEQKLKVPQ